MLPTSIPDASGNEKSGLDMYFLEQDGGTFKATVREVAFAQLSYVPDSEHAAQAI